MRKEVISAEKVIDWILEHEQLTEDFLRHFDLNSDDTISLDVVGVNNYIIDKEDL